MRTGLADNVLRSALEQDAKDLPEDEARDLYRFVHEERTLKFIALQNDAIKDYKEPSDAVLMPFYENNKERYAIPETRSFSMIILTPDSVKGIEISDDEIKKTYESSKATYGIPEKRVVQQAIFKDQATADAAVAKAKKGGAAAWSAEQTVTKDALSPELAEAAFAAGKGDIVGPVQDARGLGWRALVVRNIIPGKDRPLAEVKDQVRKDLLSSRVSEELYKMSGKLDDQLAGGTSLEDAAKDMGLTIKKFGPVSADGAAPGGHGVADDYPKDAPAILKTVFEQSEGEASPVQELKDDTFAAYRVDHITPKSYKPLAAVKDELKKIWVADQQDTLNRNRALAALQALDSGKKTLEQVAQDDHAQIQTLTLKRGDQPAAPLTPAAKDKFFSVDKGKNAIAPAKGGYVVGQVTAIRLPDADKIPAAALKDLSDTVAGSEKDKYLEAYAGYLRGKYGYTINNEVLKQTYGGSADSGNGQN
jgi:peptidyl-prolyl cis-trans isomerase D